MLQGLITRMNHHHHQQPAIVMDESLSNLTSAFGESASASTSSINPSVGELSVYPPPPLHQQDQQHLQNYYSQQDHPPPNLEPPPSKKKRSLPGNPDPDAEVIALSPKSLLATNRFMCEICNKGFQRDQNLQLHRRGHNLPWKLKQRSKEEVVRKKVYVCPETSCVHHDPSRALGDLTGIKKHFCRKHGEKKWKCDKCSKRYAVQSDWKAHSKICGTREYRCDCGTLFSRRDSFITHRAFCDALTEETARSITANPLAILPTSQQNSQLQAPQNNSSAGAGSVSQQPLFNLQNPQLINAHDLHPPSFSIKQEQHHETRPDQTFNLMIPPWLHQPPSSSSSSTMMFSQELLQTLRGRDKNPSHAPSGPSSCSFPIGGGPSASPSSFPSPHPHMSATALLQKAAQFGATMSGKITDQQQPQGPPPPHAAAIPSPILSPRDHQDQLSTSSIGFFNQAPGIAVNCGNGGGNFPSSSQSSLLLHDIMMNSLSSFDGGGGSGNDDQMTRDFLGLRPLSHSEMLSFAGLGSVAGGGDESGAAANASSSSTSQHDQDRHNKSWQG